MPAVSKKQQKFFGIVRSVQKGEQSPTTPEVAKAAADMKKGDVKKFASTKRKGLPEKKKIEEESNPRIPRKKGQPANSKKHSDLYTDENPKGTIHGLGFKNVDTAKASVSKIRNSSRSHAHKIQAAVAMEQRAREMGKSSEAAVYRKYINSMKKKTKKMNKEEVEINEILTQPFVSGSLIRNIPKAIEAGKTTYKVIKGLNTARKVAPYAATAGLGVLVAKDALSKKKKKKKTEKMNEDIQKNRKITFPEMQKRIRDAKERRRDQKKESEKLYIDTKNKGVKFYDKKGSGRLKDGKKIYN